MLYFSLRDSIWFIGHKNGRQVVQMFMGLKIRFNRNTGNKKNQKERADKIAQRFDKSCAQIEFQLPDLISQMICSSLKSAEQDFNVSKNLDLKIQPNAS